MSGIGESSLVSAAPDSSTLDSFLAYRQNESLVISESDITPDKSFIGEATNKTLETTYTYDGLLQLSQAETKVGGTTIYDVTTGYDPAGRISFKGSTPTSGISYVDAGLDYQATVTYNTSKPHQIGQVSEVVTGGTATMDYFFNPSGSVRRISRNLNGDTTGYRRMLWNEEQWMVADRVNSGVHHYVYDYNGERIMKTSYTYTTVWQNDNAISSLGVLDAYTVYVNPYIVKSYYDNSGVIEEETTYHYYMNTQRVASGRFSENIFVPPVEMEEGISTSGAESSSPGVVVTDQLVNVLEEFGYAEGEDFERSDLEEPVAMETIYPEFTASYPSEPGYSEPEAMGEEGGGGSSEYEYCEGVRTEVYWYHPNYLGNVDLITNRIGEVHQYFLYTAWGESMHEYNAQSTGFDSPYRFNGKELDEETGNYYYGARYYDPKVSVWLSVDAMASKYPNSSPYVFVANNPINLIDPDGMKWVNAHDDDVAAAQANYDSKETGLGRFFAGMKLNSAKKAQGRVDNALQELKAGDEDLYNYVDNLQVSDNNGNTRDVNVSVSSDGRSEGLGGQKAQTAYLTNGTPSANYKGGKIALPIRPGSTDIGFNVSLYGAESFMDVSLSNEAGDIMFFMEYNAEAVSSGGDAKFFKPGGGGYDAYVKSPQGSYSFKVQNLYRERKNMDKKSNVWPLKR